MPTTWRKALGSAIFCERPLIRHFARFHCSAPPAELAAAAAIRASRTSWACTPGAARATSTHASSVWTHRRSSPTTCAYHTQPQTLWSGRSGCRSSPPQRPSCTRMATGWRARLRAPLQHAQGVAGFLPRASQRPDQLNSSAWHVQADQHATSAWLESRYGGAAREIEIMLDPPSLAAAAYDQWGLV